MTDEKDLRYCPNCPNHCREDGCRCVIGMNHFGHQPEPWWIKKSDREKQAEREEK